MKTLFIGLVQLVFVLHVTAKGTSYNMLFEPGQKTLTDEQKQQLDDWASTTKDGERITIYPLTKEPGYDIFFYAKNAREQAIKIVEYGETIGFESLGMPARFPSGYKGLSVRVDLKYNKSKAEITADLPGSQLQNHYPPKASQFFVIDPNRDTLVVGNEGTQLLFKAGSLKAKEKVWVELKEFYGLDDYMKNGLPTVSNGKMIETGGSIFLNATKDGVPEQPVAVNPEIGIDVGFTGSEEGTGMQIFVKDPRSKQKMNWVLPEKPKREADWQMTKTILDPDGNVVQELVFNSQAEWDKYQAEDKRKKEQRQADALKRQEMQETFMKKRMAEQKEREIIGQKFHIVDLGFINCDRFIDEPMIKFSVPEDQQRVTEYYLVFSSVRGVMKSHSDINNTAAFGAVPRNRRARLVAISFDGDQAYYFESYVVPGQGSPPNMELKPVDESYLDQRLAALK